MNSFKLLILLLTSTSGMAKVPAPVKKEIVIAVIDTGIDIRKNDLASKLWINPGESGPDIHGKNKQNNQIDDDHNGFVDDVSGWDFSSASNATQDHHGHGTHIAGVIAGLAPRAKILPLKYYDPKNQPANDVSGNISTTVQAIRYAIKMHVDIINYSGGGAGKDQEEEQAIRAAEKAGILVVAAAGNDGRNTDSKGYFPASYLSKNIISVASLDSNSKILDSSNYGVSTVDLGAPGKNIVSNFLNGAQLPMTGTSQATAVVTGTAAQILVDQQLPYECVKAIIISSVDASTGLVNKTNSGGSLNRQRALSTKTQRQNALGTYIQEPAEGPMTLQKISELTDE